MTHLWISMHYLSWPSRTDDDDASDGVGFIAPPLPPPPEMNRTIPWPLFAAKLAAAAKLLIAA